MHEVEDAVLRRVQTGDKCGPGYRTLRRHGRAQPPEAALVPQACGVGQVAPVPLQEARIHAIDAQHDDLPPMRLRSMAPCHGRRRGEHQNQNPSGVRQPGATQTKTHHL